VAGEPVPLIRPVKRSFALIVRIVPSFLTKVREKNFPFVASMRAVISSLVGAFCIVFGLLVGGESVSGFLKFVNLFFAVLNKSLQTCQSIASCAENKETNTIKQFVFSAINGESAKAESRREGDNSRGDDGKCMFHFFLVLLVGGERIVFLGQSVNIFLGISTVRSVIWFFKFITTTLPHWERIIISLVFDCPHFY